jgi:hypothetical protein
MFRHRFSKPPAFHRKIALRKTTGSGPPQWNCDKG